MSLPNSFYEAVVQGFAGTGRIDGRRALFLFLVNHSEPMLSPLAETSKPRLDAVVEVLNRMKVEMAQLDNGRHLDVGFIGYPLESISGKVYSMWSDNDSGRVIRPVDDVTTVERKPIDHANGGITNALEQAAQLVIEWKQRNPDPIIKPIVLHIIPIEGGTVPDLQPHAESITNSAGALLFHCCFNDRIPENIFVPASDSVPSGRARQFYELSSQMPPLMEDIGQLMRGYVSPRLRRAAEDLANKHGIPRGLASFGAELLAEALTHGVRLPTGSPGWSVGVKASVSGLRIDSNRGFAFVKGMIGFQVFTKLFN